MSFDLDAPEPGLAEVELAPGLTATIRPLTGQLDSRAQAEITGMAADLRSGAAAATRFGLDVGTIADKAALTGLPEFARMVVLGSLTIGSWTLTRKGEPVVVSEVAVAELFNRHPTTLAAFRNHLYAAAAERLAAGKVYAASPSTTSGEAASPAPFVKSRTIPAAEVSPPSSPADTAPTPSSLPVTRKRSPRGRRSRATGASPSEPGSTAS